MTKNTLFCLIISILLLSTSFKVGIAQEAKPTSAENTNNITLAGGAQWFLQHVDGAPGNSVGMSPSVAYSPIDGLPYISYYNFSTQELWLASPVPYASGNCGVENNWWCRMVDTDGDVGMYSSIDLWKSSSIIGRWKLGISYYDTTNRALKLAIYTCSGLPPCAWNIVQIDYSSLVSQTSGQFSSLKFSSDGTPLLAYYHTNTLSTDELRYTYPVTDGGNCGTGAALGKWQCDYVDTGDGIGKYASLDIRWDDSASIGYYDEGNGNLKYAYYAGFGNCGINNAWICNPVDGTNGSDVGLYASLQTPQSAADIYRIAYYDKTNGQLKIAYSYTGGNCGNGWQCDVVDDMGTSLLPMGISMAVDTLGNPIIAYQQIASDLSPSVLRIARPAYSLGLFVGNCGDVPPGYLFMYWQCEMLDNASAYTNEAAYLSVALNEDGLATIAYSESDDYYNFDSLKIAYQTFTNLYLPLTIKAP